MIHNPNEGGKSLAQIQKEWAILKKTRKEKIPFAKAKAKRKKK